MLKVAFTVLLTTAFCSCADWKATDPCGTVGDMVICVKTEGPNARKYGTVDHVPLSAFISRLKQAASDTPVKRGSNEAPMCTKLGDMTLCMESKSLTKAQVDALHADAVSDEVWKPVDPCGVVGNMAVCVKVEGPDAHRYGSVNHVALKVFIDRLTKEKSSPTPKSVKSAPLCSKIGALTICMESKFLSRSAVAALYNSDQQNDDWKPKDPCGVLGNMVVCAKKESPNARRYGSVNHVSMGAFWSRLLQEQGDAPMRQADPARPVCTKMGQLTLCMESKKLTKSEVDALYADEKEHAKAAAEGKEKDILEKLVDKIGS